MRLPPKDRLLIPVIWFLTITWLSTKGGLSLPGFKLISADKLSHASAYALLVWLLLTAYREGTRTMYISVGLFAFCYGAFMEFIQYRFFPNRYFEVDDMIANGIGALLGITFYHWVTRPKP